MLQPGQVLGGKYRVERALGEGGMGVVYAATNVMLEKRVALKVLSPEFAAQPEWVGRLLREAVAASRTRHPGIVQVFDAGQDVLGPWIAMELLEGESLRARLGRVGRLSVDATRIVSRGVLDALAAVHDAGIVHRDLKPDNVFLEPTPDGERTKLLDFGIAKQLDAVVSLTKSGMVMGTAHYLAPEQARDARWVDARTDLYAVGVILYECLSGTTPYEGKSAGDLLAKLLTEPPRDLRALAPHVPSAIIEVISMCLARAPSGRPSSARELSRLLDAAATGVSPPHAAPPLPAPAHIPATMPSVSRTEVTRSPRSRAWIVIVAVVALAAVGAAVWLALR